MNKYTIVELENPMTKFGSNVSSKAMFLQQYERRRDT